VKSAESVVDVYEIFADDLAIIRDDVRPFAVTRVPMDVMNTACYVRYTSRVPRPLWHIRKLILRPTR